MAPLAPDEVTFALATRADLDALCDLMGAYYREDGLEVTPESTRGALAHLFRTQETGYDLGRIWFLRRGDVHIGYLALTWVYSFEYGGRVGAVDELYVQPDSRGRGVGGTALGFAERVCRELGMTGLSLEVEPRNEGARRFYERFGFREVERHFLLKRL